MKLKMYKIVIMYNWFWNVINVCLEIKSAKTLNLYCLKQENHYKNNVYIKYN